MKYICQSYCHAPRFDPCQIKNLKVPEHWNVNLKSSSSTDIKNQNIDSQIQALLNKLLQANSQNIADILKLNSTRNLEHRLVPKMWRYLPMADPLVDYFLIRDIDSFVLPREVAAVQQWIQNSTFLIHAMRDHPSHNGVILAGKSYYTIT